NTFIDNYRTPHSDKLHVTERFSLIEGGQKLQADITIEDPIALKQPLHVVHQWRKVQGPMTESRCADGEMNNPFGQRAEPLPVTDDPTHPHVGNGRGRQSTFRVADVNNPNLTDFAKESLRMTNEEVFRGKAVFSREARCWPTGVPTYDLNQAQPVYFIQTPKEIVMMWQMDHQVRHIYLDVPHSANPQLSWYGESVGHYDGDALVVDTIGQNTKTYI